MINLIYVILLAMLAINVSDDVMKGYTVLNKSYGTQNNAWGQANRILLARLKASGNDTLYAKALKTDSMSRQLEVFIDGLKEKIAMQADKKDYEKGKLVKEEELKSVPYVMLAPTQNNGAKLRRRLESLRDTILSGMREVANKEIVATYLSTTPPKNIIGTSFSWERECFSSLPAIGGVLLLNRIKENILLSENEALRDLLLQASGAIDVSGEIRNVPLAESLSSGNPQSDNGPIEAGSINDLYSGMGNSVNLFPSMSPHQLSVTTDNGRASLENGKWKLYPQNSSRKANVTVRRKSNGQVLGKFSFNVKPLPDPQPYLQCSGGRYKGGVPIGKRRLSGGIRLGASYSDGDVDIAFKIISFETVFIRSNGGIETLRSHGGNFSSNQLERIHNLSSGDKFYVTSIIAADGNGNRREIESLNVIVN